MKKIIRLHYHKDASKDSTPPERFIHGEWLVTNGLGGYCSNTVIGLMTRKYHGVLVSALPPPLGRTVMLGNLIEEVVMGERRFLLNCEEKPDGSLVLEALKYLKSFYLENGLPVWVYEMEGLVLEKRLFMSHRQNTVYIVYKLLAGGETIRIRLTPYINFRSHEAPLDSGSDHYVVAAHEKHYEITKSGFPALRLAAFGPRHHFLPEEKQKNTFLRIESSRGYESIGKIWSPGVFELDLVKDVDCGFIASSEPARVMHAMTPAEAVTAELRRRARLLELSGVDESMTAELILAADQFIITPENRIEDMTRANASGEEIRTIIAGYHWFTDWGRDTMICLEGLTLCTNRIREASWILKTFAHYVKDGLIPNMFPDYQKEGLYHTADATMWFFHAIDRYFTRTNDKTTLDLLIPTLIDIVHYHVKGTHFGIHMDPSDGLIHQGAEGYQLTWMDAKVGDWVVTPRRGKSVEINALWYNALRLMQDWLSLQGETEKSLYYAQLADRVYQSFNERFWIKDKNYLYDVIDGEKGNDDALRPNQLFAISLRYPALEPSKWPLVVEICKQKLLTPFGLRTLSPDNPEFKSRYGGDLLTRDASYHQGTVWPWLIGPYIDSYLKVFPDDKKGAHSLLKAFETTLGDTGVGTICEIYDAIDPQTPQGCMAQGWSVAEVLRVWMKTTS